MQVLIKRPNLTTYQKDFLYNESRFTITEASTKVGKAQPLTSKIYTPIGVKFMGDIRIGDEVLQPMGQIAKVVDIFEHPNKEVYKITFNDNTYTHCCLDHLWTISIRNRPFKTIPLSEILKISKNELRHIKLPNHGIANFNNKEVKIHPYLLGILISDGSITTSGIKFSSNDEELVRYIDTILPKKHRLKKLKNYDYTIAIENNATQEAWHGITIANYLRELGLFGLKSDKKFIPESYKYNSEFVRLEVLRGILDGDGYVDHNGQARIEQTSEKLSNDIKEVIESLGGMVKTTFKQFNYRTEKNGNRILGKSVYRQGIVFKDCSQLFRLKRKKDKCLTKKKPVNRNFKSIELVGNKDSRCIKIDNENGLYLTDDFIVTHNTFSHIWWIYEQAHADWNKVNYNHWWVAPVYSQAKIAFNRLKAKVSRTGIYKINETNLIITTPIGTHIHFKSGEKPDNLFGEDVYSCVFDEAPRARVDCFYALRSTITSTGGKMKLIGNFGGSSNWMHQLKEKASTDKEYAYYKITAWDAVKEGILQESEILQAQKDLPSKIFKQLYLAEEQESDDQLCTYDSINAMWTNSFVPEGEGYITADIALHGSDKFVIIVWSGFRVINYTEIEKCDAKEVEGILRQKALQFKIKQSNIVYDADGLGSFLRGYLKDAKPFNNGAKPIKGLNYKNLKSECGYELAKLVNEGGVYFDCEMVKEDIIKEFECLQSYGLDSDGKIQLLPKAKIKELIGHSPDRLDAFMMRMYFELKPKIKRMGGGYIN